MSRPYLETLRRAPVAWHPLSAPRSVQEQVEVLYRYKPAGMQPRTRQPCCPQEAPARYLQQYLALHPLGGIATRRRAALEPIRLKQSLLSSPRFLSPAKRPPTPPCFVFPIHCLSFFVRLRRNLQVLFPHPPSLSSSFSPSLCNPSPSRSFDKLPPGDVVPSLFRLLDPQRCSLRASTPLCRELRRFS